MLDTISKFIKFDVRNRVTGAVQFTAEIECAADALTSVKLGLAIKWAIKSRANLSGADLSGAHLSRANLSRADLSGANLSGAHLSRANLSRADLSGADLSGANLSGANLSGAHLSRANLSGADLSRADLSGAYLSRANLSGQWIIQGATRSDGYAFFLQKLTADTEPMVKAGCRYFTLRAAQAHWEKTHAGTALLTETSIIVRSMVDLAHARGLMKDGKAVEQVTS